MSSEKYTVEVLVNGKPVKKYNHQSKVYIEGRSGTEYSLRLRNNSFDRVLAIISVDGVNVITGQVASENDTGYIIDPNSSIDVSGFRKDKNTVGSFVFRGKNESYSKDGRACYAIANGDLLMIQAGCFWGTLDEFERAALDRYGDDENNYKVQIKYLRTIK